MCVYVCMYILCIGSLQGATLITFTNICTDLKGAKLEALRTMISTLAPSNVKKNKSLGVDSLFHLYTEEINDLYKGKIFVVNGVKKMVFLQIPYFQGDAPWIKELGGYSSSVTCKLACNKCLTTVNNFGPSLIDDSLIGENRDPTSLYDFYRRNGHKHGVPNSCVLLSEMESEGIKRLPALLNWPAPENEDGKKYFDNDKLCTCTMHACELGFSKKLFINLVKELSMDCSMNLDTIYAKMSALFGIYCVHNKIAVRSKFHDKLTFRSRLKANHMKEFVAVSCEILVSLGLVPTSVEVARAVNQRKRVAMEQKVQSFDIWCTYVQIMKILNSRKISSKQLHDTEELINKVLLYTAVRRPTLCTWNFHTFTHIIGAIKKFGPSSFWNNYSGEGIINFLFCIKYLNLLNIIYNIQVILDN